MTATRRPRTAAQVRRELARIDAQLAQLATAHRAFFALIDLGAPMPEHACDAINATSDAIDALIAERREVEANRPHLVGATAELVAANID